MLLKAADRCFIRKTRCTRIPKYGDKAMNAEQAFMTRKSKTVETTAVGREAMLYNDRK